MARQRAIKMARPAAAAAIQGQGPAARSEEPGAVVLAAVRPLGPGGSWGGLGVLRGGQLGPWAAVFGGR